jgi:transcription elongation GreA/GreB family factor
MKSIVTQKGLENLRIKLAEKINKLALLREEKAHAYTASGDGWHDNPGWTQLGQQEELLASEVNKLQQNISNSVLYEPSKMETGIVQIGCKVTFLMVKSDQKEMIQTFEIVGAGESDVKLKKIGYDSPLGKALCSMKLSEDKLVELPFGKVNIQIKEIIYG